MLTFENEAKLQGFHHVIGVDEAGRGPLAGPVVAAAVMLKDTSFESKIADSKKLSEKQRERAFEEIGDKAYIGIGTINEYVIDLINILKASHLAMNTAVRQLVSKLPTTITEHNEFRRQTCLLIDGSMFYSEVPYSYRTIVKGDDQSLSIACASIIAKVYRDRILKAYDQIFPEYGFGKHKGYGTKQHREAIKEYGPSLIHRRSFQVK